MLCMGKKDILATNLEIHSVGPEVGAHLVVAHDFVWATLISPTGPELVMLLAMIRFLAADSRTRRRGCWTTGHVRLDTKVETVALEDVEILGSVWLSKQ